MEQGAEPDERSWFPALGCILFAALLRWPTLDAQSLWIDATYRVVEPGRSGLAASMPFARRGVGRRSGRA